MTDDELTELQARELFRFRIAGVWITVCMFVLTALIVGAFWWAAQ